MKGRVWHKLFVPEDAPDDVEGVPAVTLQAGEQWRGMYMYIYPNAEISSWRITP